jgi:hypothetical protein
MLAITTPAIASAQDVYFSVGSTIRKLTLPNTATTQVYPISGGSSGDIVGDIAMCADESLFFSQGNVVKQLSLVAPITVTDVATVTAPKEIRLSAPVPVVTGRTCDVHIASASGDVYLYKFNPFGTPQWTGVVEYVATPTVSGLAISFSGSLRVSSGATIIAVPPSTATNTTAPLPVVGLGVAHHGEGSLLNVRQPTPPVGDGALCASLGNTIRCGPLSGGTLPTTVATFTENNIKAQYFELVYTDQIVAAITVETVPKTGSFNGILKRISSFGAVQELYRAPRDPVTNLYPPIIGVAVGPSSSATVTDTTPLEARFGPAIVTVITPHPCVLDLQLGGLTWTNGKHKIDSAVANLGGSGNNYVVDPSLGAESFLDNIAIKLNSQTPSNDCAMTSTNRARVFISQYNDGSRNKTIVKCEDDNVPTTSTPTDSCQVSIETSYPFTPNLPQDPTDVDIPTNFSEFLTAATVNAQGFGPAIRFSTPLNDIAGPSAVDAVLSSLAVFNDALKQEIVNRAKFASVHSQSAGLAIRFRICATVACTKFNDAEEANPPASGSGLSITRFANDGSVLAMCDVDANGGANPLIPIFRAEGQSHVFNLNPPLQGSDACALTGEFALAPGESALFGAAPFSHSGLHPRGMALFKLQNQQ